ncbi:MAG: hypothetical protein H6709_12090 [Kofleriaceae bacterium]|nr:hypothetical protein [Myxococcales bacterium]MCB9564768.1 hypothetical protein [Kofleriaceae bacterium]MCB9572817.1 hypothetical protein [Kofleriaceae bacterium]
MRAVLCAVLFAVTACGGGAKSSPAPAAPAADSAATESTGGDPAATEGGDGDSELCCCEIPSADVEHEMMPPEMCEGTGDGGQGYCVDADACSP